MQPTNSSERRNTCGSVDALLPGIDFPWDPGLSPNEALGNRVFWIMSADTSHYVGSNKLVVDTDEGSRTELDSHANMPVIGKHAYVIAETGRTVEVSPFTPDYEPIRVPLVDAAVKYECPYDGKAYILVLRNALHVPNMDINLIPPFMMREAGVQVNETPKIHMTHPTEDDHAIVFPETGFRIHLLLWGTFSYFHTSKPTEGELEDPLDVYLLTPTKWNPHSDAYAANEESIVDWEGNIKQRKDWELSTRGLRQHT